MRAKVSGTAERPRVNVFRSLRNIYVSVIDDTAGHTLCSVSLKDLPAKERANTVSGAAALGAVLAEKCKKKNIKKVVFDRAGYKYHGKVSAVAESLRQNGLEL